MKNQLRTLLSTGCYPDYMSYTVEKKNRWRCSISAYKACVRRWKCGHLMKEYLLLSCVNQLNSTRKNFRMAAESTGIEDAERPNLLQDVSVLSSIRNTDHQHRQKKANSLSQKQQVMTLWPEQRVNQTRTRHTKEHQTNHIRVIIAQRDRNPSLQRRD